MQQTVPYLLGQHRVGDRGQCTAVTDNDAAQELELNFGKEGVNDADVNEGDKLAFVIKRRQQDADTGNPAAFTVRGSRPTATVTTGGWRTGLKTPLPAAFTRTTRFSSQAVTLEVEEELRVTFNGQSESSWDYWASIRPLQHYDGGDLTSAEEAEYWTVKPGFRETTVDATDSGASNGTISIDSDVLTVTEGQAVVYTLYRVDGPMNMPVTVQVRTREPNRGGGQGSQPQHPRPRRDHRSLEGIRRIHRLSLRGRGRRGRL